MALPLLPHLYPPLTEAQIGRTVIKLMDRADATLRAGKVDVGQYNDWFDALDEWTDALYAKV